MLTRIYNWLTAPWRAETQFEANKAEGYQYAKHLLATGAAGAEEHLVNIALSRNDGYDIGVLLALHERYTTY
jgi:hypothetical protein